MADSETRPSFRIPARLDLLIEQLRPHRAMSSCATSSSPRSRGWRTAASTTNWPEDSIATRSMSAGSCRISRRCATTTRNCSRTMCTPIRQQARSSSPSVARDIIRWMDEWLSDREHGGFYASQDADYSMDDDGDYFTWTVRGSSSRSHRRRSRGRLPALRHQRSRRDASQSGEECALRARLGRRNRQASEPAAAIECEALLQSAKKKMYAARLKRPTPYVDKTVYVGWNALCISAYLEAAKVLELEDCPALCACARWIASWPRHGMPDGWLAARDRVFRSARPSIARCRAAR